MHKCHTKDTIDFQNGKPALRKIQNIDDVIMKLSRSHIQKQFLAQKGLDNIADWIYKLPNGSEPPISLKKKLLQFVYGLPVKKQNLSGIKLGKIIYKISMKSDVKELKSIASKIVEKWSQLLNQKEEVD
ncbi:hypothetical protein IMG5_117580 [Ichthyophthirius multifiliis]|uniref:TFIIS N-terminal domain-containing protein n=1 Tax=Ichthyophthirius multifiliis TaxID=5932 RepID=G0QUJ5_ICHMU|nr:hypothetical protein IMG5_117580 [Ichthyophthirius multifiliis]EGR31115.1 hypothetical protein IMG5_117580 [Ichthyophthirius multifiliis]|eukprot:XP_004034601.1 hypothetical protein IMG5_117580 [Ichthyophthirius multifiliis]